MLEVQSTLKLDPCSPAPSPCYPTGTNLHLESGVGWVLQLCTPGPSCHSNSAKLLREGRWEPVGKVTGK